MGPIVTKIMSRGTYHMGNRPYFRWPSIMLMSSSKPSSKSPFPEMRQKTLAPKHNLSILQIVHHKRRGMGVRESGNSEEADDFVFGWNKPFFFSCSHFGKDFLSRSECILPVKMTWILIGKKCFKIYVLIIWVRWFL